MASENMQSSVLPTTVQNQKIVVIGAGVAGLAAARYLQSQGLSVTILEARDRIGGRVWTDTSWGVPVDLGAAWIHGIDNNPIYELAQQLKITTIPTDFENLLLYDQGGREFSELEYEQLAIIIEEIFEILEDLKASADPNTSIATAIQEILADQQYPGTLNRAIQWVLSSSIELEYAASLSELALSQWDEDEDFAGDDVMFPQGFQQIVAGLGAGLQVQLQHPVTQIHWHQSGVKIITNQGEFEGNYAIITVPLGVLKQGSIEFIPGLPKEKQGAIQRLEMGTLNKVVLKFPEIFWPEMVHSLGFLTAGNLPLDYWNLVRIVNQPILVGLSGGKNGRGLETRSEAAVIEEIMTHFRQTFGHQIPDPVATTITRWSQEPWTYGSYSHVPPGASFADYDTLAQPVDQRLFFAGEATHSQYPGTVHGAFLSGEREAKRIVQLLLATD